MYKYRYTFLHRHTLTNRPRQSSGTPSVSRTNNRHSTAFTFSPAPVFSLCDLSVCLSSTWVHVAVLSAPLSPQAAALSAKITQKEEEDPSQAAVNNQQLCFYQKTKKTLHGRIILFTTERRLVHKCCFSSTAVTFGPRSLLSQNTTLLFATCKVEQVRVTCLAWGHTLRSKRIS